MSLIKKRRLEPDGFEPFFIWHQASNIARDELGFFDSLSPAKVVTSIVNDARNMGGDNSYKVDIGV